MAIASRRLQFSIKLYDLPLRGGIVRRAVRQTTEIIISQMKSYHEFANLNFMKKNAKRNEQLRRGRKRKRNYGNRNAQETISDHML